jgi:hypothetical protein
MPCNRVSLENLLNKHDHYRHKQHYQDHRSYDSAYGHDRFAPLLSFSWSSPTINRWLLASIPASNMILNRFDIVMLRKRSPCTVAFEDLFPNEKSELFREHQLEEAK